MEENKTRELQEADTLLSATVLTEKGITKEDLEKIFSCDGSTISSGG